jgi:hypothetical protein
MRPIGSTIFCFLVITLFCASQCWAQSGVAKPATPTGTITGRVINSSGQPIAGASIYAGLISSNVRGKTATADSHGDFKLDGLEPGLYSMSASMPGYVFASRPTASDSPNYYRLGDSVTFTLTKGGVITGTVTGPNGPLVGVGIFATRVRDTDGKKLSGVFPGGFERRTDDRGMFRLYGLPPGAYIVMASRPRVGTILPSTYDLDVPTYYPSGTRDTAAEILVREGDEITADIQYRGEPGHAISGKISGVAADNQLQFTSGPQITLTDLRDRTQIASSPTSLTDNSAFAIYGVPDGEYELSTRQFLPTRNELGSPPQHVTVRGADVTGLNVRLGPLASIEGRVVFESDPKAACGKRKDTAAQETMIYARQYEPEKKTNVAARTAPLPEVPLLTINQVSLGVGDAKGSFTLRNLPAGSYRIDPRPPASGWYVRSITIGAAQTATARAASLVVARDGLTLRAGERVSGLTVTIAEGGASFRGRLTVAEGKGLPLNLRVYLVPDEKESVDDVLRFFETRADADGSFALGNLAPGHYWMIARAADESESAKVKAIRQDSALRSQVVKEAERTRNEIQLQPCQRIVDYEMRYSPVAADTRPKP